MKALLSSIQEGNENEKGVEYKGTLKTAALHWD
jgi:hypothetical protein